MPGIPFCAAVLLLGATLSACSTLSVVNAVSPGRFTQAASGLRYGADARNRLDVYRPPQQDGAAPVSVFFYGGNWLDGERKDYAYVGRALAGRGFVVVVPDYRLYPQVRYPGFLEDAAQAVAWTERGIARYGGDPHKVFVMGHSAGAYNAAMLALDGRWLGKQGLAPSVLRGWIGLAGPDDLLPVENRTTRPVFDYPYTKAESQPIDHVGKDAPPALLIAGRKDETVNPERNTVNLAQKLRAAGVPVREAIHDGVGHAGLAASLSSTLRRIAPTLDAVEDFVCSDGGRVSGAGTCRRTSGPAR